MDEDDNPQWPFPDFTLSSSNSQQSMPQTDQTGEMAQQHQNALIDNFAQQQQQLSQQRTHSLGHSQSQPKSISDFLSEIEELEDRASQSMRRSHSDSVDVLNQNIFSALSATIAKSANDVNDDDLPLLLEDPSDEVCMDAFQDNLPRPMPNSAAGATNGQRDGYIDDDDDLLLMAQNHPTEGGAQGNAVADDETNDDSSPPSSVGDGVSAGQPAGGDEAEEIDNEEEEERSESGGEEDEELADSASSSQHEEEELSGNRKPCTRKATVPEVLLDSDADEERPSTTEATDETDYFDRQDAFDKLYFHHIGKNSEDKEQSENASYLSIHSIYKSHWEASHAATLPFRHCIISKLSDSDRKRHARLVNTKCWQWEDATGATSTGFTNGDVLLPSSLVVDESASPPPQSSTASSFTAVKPKQLRRHQIEGIRFLWSCLVEAPTCSRRRRYDVEQERQQLELTQQKSFNSTTPAPDGHLFPDHVAADKKQILSATPVIRVNGYGCILAHSMGLGKTAQVAIFMNLFAKHVIRRPRIVICTPKSTLSGWEFELKQWGKFIVEDPTSLKEEEEASAGKASNFKGLRTYLIDGSTAKSLRLRLAHHWHIHGGVLLLGYESLISLQRELHREILSRNSTKRNINHDTDDDNFTRDVEVFSEECPVDLVVCDEAHRLKSNDLGAMKALKKLHPVRRLLLTGTPLQNHLMEYWTMLSFTLPNFFEKRWFQQFFIRPISRAMENDAKPSDIDISKKKTFALIKEVEPFVQRVDSTPLKSELPKLYEFVVMVHFTPLQKQLYDGFLQLLTKQKASTGAFNLLQANAYANKICGHPQLLFGSSVALEARNLQKSAAKGLDSTTSDSEDSVNEMLGIESHKKKASEKGGDKAKNTATAATSEAAFSFGNFFSVPKNYIPATADSCKFAMAFEIIARAVANNEKVLVFSFSTQLLDLFSALMDTDLPSSIKYYRIDGSTSSSMREEMINRFEASKNTLAASTSSDTTHQTTDGKSADVFLLSTKAGGVGLTLTAATRVIMLDTSFNPADDRQAVGRAYRYGQTKPVYVYRIVVQDSFEHRLLDQKNAKEWLFQTVVDTKTIKRDHLVGLKIRDALMLTPEVSEAEWNLRHRRSAVCFRCDEKILLKLAEKITFVLQHEGFFEEGDDKYGEEEVQWYAQYQTFAKKSADSGLDPAIGSLLTLNGKAVDHAAVKEAIANDAQLKYHASLDPKKTTKELRQMVANDAKSLSAVLNGILHQRRQDSQLALLRESGIHGRTKSQYVGIGMGAGGTQRGVIGQDDVFGTSSHSAQSTPLSNYPSTNAFLAAKKRYEAAKRFIDATISRTPQLQQSHNGGNHPTSSRHGGHHKQPPKRVTNTKDSAISLDDDSQPTSQNTNTAAQSGSKRVREEANAQPTGRPHPAQRGTDSNRRVAGASAQPKTTKTNAEIVDLDD